MSRKRMSSIRPPPPVRPPSTDGRPKNRLLAALPAEDFRRILPDLETIPLMVQSTACMALHHVTERCCRWLLWRRADKHRGIVLRDDFRPSFGKEDAGDLGSELIDTTDLKVVEGDAIDGSRWTCDDFET